MRNRIREHDSPEHLQMIKARTSLVMHEPFFGNLALQMELVEDPRVQTMSVNGSWIKYNPIFVNELTHDETVGVVAHEVMHVAMMHHMRRNERAHELWQQACDHAINHILKKANFTLPEGGLWERRFYGMNAEAIYNIMYDEALDDLKKQQEQSKDDDECEGLSAAHGEDSDDDNKTNGNDESPPEETQSDEKQQESSDQKPAQQQVPDPGGYGAVEDAEALEEMTDKEKENLEKEWKDNVMAAATSQKMQGNMPEWMEEFVGGIKEPKLHYTELLRDFLEDKAKNDYSMMHPNTRYAQVTRDCGMALPGMYSEEVGNIGFIIDSSGSISIEEKERYATEISKVLEDFPNMDIDVVYVDTRVASVQHLTNDDLPIELNFKGGGGTNFRPGFEWFEENGVEPKAVIYFTDGWCRTFPKEEPEYPVLWLCTSGEEQMTTGYGKVPFGEVIGLEID